MSENTENKEISKEEGQKADKKTVVRKQKKRIDPNTLVTVYCNVGRGNLTYRSENTNRRFDWPQYNSFVDMELGELQNMPAHYFENNWIRLDDQEIVDYLRVGHFYKDSINETDVENFFEMDTDEMERFLNKIKPFERSLVVNRVKDKIKDKSFDSAHKIDFIERKYNINLRD